MLLFCECNSVRIVQNVENEVSVERFIFADVVAYQLIRTLNGSRKENMHRSIWNENDPRRNCFWLSIKHCPCVGDWCWCSSKRWWGSGHGRVWTYRERWSTFWWCHDGSSSTRSQWRDSQDYTKDLLWHWPSLDGHGTFQHAVNCQGIYMLLLNFTLS